MSWQGIQGHDDVVERFRRSLVRGRLATTFLFVGPPGIGKHTFALKLAQSLLCPSVTERLPERLEPCGHCASCALAAAGTHPDLLRVAKPTDKNVIPVELLIGDDDHRMTEGLCHDIALKPFMGGRRIAIIDDADVLDMYQAVSANALLKTLEEPPPHSVLILIGTSIDRQLPTIRSRSQIIRFRPLDEEVLAALLVAQGEAAAPDEARRLARYSQGSLSRAKELADPALWDFRRQLLERLSQPRLESVQLGKLTGAFIDAAGKEAPPRRARARQIVAFAVEFYRQVCRALCGAAPSDDAELAGQVNASLAAWRGDAETAAACADRTLEALSHIDRNANQGAWIDGWLDDLAQLTSRSSWPSGGIRSSVRETQARAT
ncbi:MAG TPA: DNA polymerase III subunit delta' [Pirellulales bacterium]|nr:DNA polymerase III subunit delta' [Pirellulales bacterium]